MYRGGRGTRGPTGGFWMRGVPQQQLKPGRGGRWQGGAPEPLMAAGWRPMTMAMPYPAGRPPVRPLMHAPMRAPMRAPNRVWVTPGRGRGAPRASHTAAASAAAPASMDRRSRSERDKDAIVMTRPWVTEAACVEIRKKHTLQDLSMKTKSEADFKAFKEQRTKVTSLLRVLKLEYIGRQEEQDVEKIMAEAALKSRPLAPVEATLTETGKSNGSGDANVGMENGSGHAIVETEIGPGDTTIKTENGPGDTTFKTENGPGITTVKTENGPGDTTVKTENGPGDTTVKTENGTGDSSKAAAGAADATSELPAIV